jgi:hypothetical protein
MQDDNKPPPARPDWIRYCAVLGVSMLAGVALSAAMGNISLGFPLGAGIAIALLPVLNKSGKKKGIKRP